KWIDHLNAMEYLREGIHLRGYAQQDPLVAYKKEAFEMFQELLDAVQDEIVEMMYHVHLVRQPPRRQLFNPLLPDPTDPMLLGQPLADDLGSIPPRRGNGRGNGHGAADLGAAQPKVGRNDPCPCGSGKKYKKCCLAKVEG